MALQTEIWINDIMENLFQSSAFIQRSVSHDGYVTNKTVHVPQAGSKPNVVVNRSSYPATIAQRTDSDLTYSLSEFSTDPTLVTNIDELQVSYDKRMSVMGNNLSVLSETVGNYIANYWSPSGSINIIRTTGADQTDALSTGATGTRKAVTLLDIANLAKKLDKDLVPRENRFLLMPSDMFWQLFQISEVVRASYNGFQVQPSTVATGTVAQLFGFNIFMRPSVTIFTNDAPPVLKAVSAGSAADDNLGCLAWHQSFVAKALGSIDVFADSGDNGKGKPEYYGVLLSSLVMMGGTILRSDSKGVVNLVQGQ